MKLGRILCKNLTGEDQATQHAYCCSCLVSDSAILLPYKCSAHDRTQQQSNKQAHSPLKTMPGNIGNRCQSYCATYKTQTMTTHHGGVGHTGKERDLNPHIEDAETWMTLKAQTAQKL